MGFIVPHVNIQLEDNKQFISNTPRNMCCGYSLESPRPGHFNKPPQNMFLIVIDRIFLSISNFPSHFEQWIPSIQNIVITSFVVISLVVIKRVTVKMQANPEYPASDLYTVNPLYTDILYSDKTRYNDNLNGMNP